MGILMFGLMVMAFIYLMIFNIRLLLSIIGVILFLGFAWVFGLGVLMALISAVA
jgi:hypothetical protein